MQSRLHSVIEVFLNTAIGFLGSWIITELTLRWHLSPVTLGLEIVIWCTVWSLVRGYVLRRWFATRALRSVPSTPPSGLQ